MELMNFQTILKSIFAFIWSKRLENQKLIKVTGWRSCIIDNKCGQRMRVTFMILLPPFNKARYLRGNTEVHLNTFTSRPRDPNDTSTTGII